MIKCPRCSGFVGSTMTCSGCHYSLGEPAIIELYRQPDYCPNCGAENHNYSKFCHRCQVQVHSDAQIDALYALVISRSLKERAYQAEISGQSDRAKELHNDLHELKPLKTIPENIQHHHVPSLLADKEVVTSQLALHGARISCYCCYCGAVLTLEATSPDIPNYCPQCGVELDAINFKKMMQHALPS